MKNCEQGGKKSEKSKRACSCIIFEPNVEKIYMGVFSIAIDADVSFYVKTIETHTCALLTLNILAIGSVC